MDAFSAVVAAAEMLMLMLLFPLILGTVSRLSAGEGDIGGRSGLFVDKEPTDLIRESKHHD